MLTKLASDFRFMQLYAHNAHNLLNGDTFFQDHAFLGDLYHTYEDAYDDCIERMIGLDEKFDIININATAFETLKKAGLPSNYAECFPAILHYEKFMCAEIEKVISNYSEGTKQMLGTFADDSEKRQYKIKQRIGK